MKTERGDARKERVGYEHRKYVLLSRKWKMNY